MIGRPHLLAHRDREVEARIANWARWARGRIAPYRLSVAEEEAGVMDEIDAQVVEIAMCRLRRLRPAYWPFVEARWLRGWCNVSIADDCGRSETWVRTRTDAVVAYLTGALDSLAIVADAPRLESRAEKV